MPKLLLRAELFGDRAIIEVLLDERLVASFAGPKSLVTFCNEGLGKAKEISSLLRLLPEDCDCELLDDAGPHEPECLVLLRGKMEHLAQVLGSVQIEVTSALGRKKFP